MIKYKEGDIVECIHTYNDNYIQGNKYILKQCSKPYRKDLEYSNYDTRLVVYIHGSLTLDACCWIYHPGVYKCFKLVNAKRNHLPWFMKG